MILSTADRDPSVHPGVDFYRFANGGWLDANPIPPGYGAWGAFEEVQLRNDDVLHSMLLRAAQSPQDDLDRKLGDYFASGMDIEAIEVVGITPIEPLLDAIAKATTHADVLALVPTLHDVGISVFFAWASEVDHEDSRRYLLWLAQSGLGLPDRDSYFDSTDAAVALRSAYVNHVAAQLVNVGTPSPDASDLAAAVLAFETRLAEKHLRTEERRDLDRTFNRHDMAALAELAPELDLPAYLIAIGAGAARTVNVEHPDYLAALHGIVVDSDLPTLRAYLTFHVVAAVADALPAAFDDEAFAFYGRLVEGKKEQKERYKRVIAALGNDMGEALGQRFVDETFPPSAKDRALAMVSEILGEMRTSLQTRVWMNPETRRQGLVKLDALRVKIGYPDEWRDWSGLAIDRSAYAANRLKAARFELDRHVARLDRTVDINEWEMPPHAVNAYFHPFRNEIVFPAGILQPPMFDADADDAINFGGIGAVIAHEITHGFDDQGRRFDENGAFRDWWTPEDQQHFTELAERLVVQYDAYIAVEDVHVNGRLTLGENIADLGGVALSQRAHARVSADTPPIDDLSPAQRFFLAHATLWRGNTSDELARTLAQIDPHSPRRLRVVGPFSNLDAFQGAFGLDDDAPMLRAREERIEIW
jgi:predicted metalloendopeptidase